MPNNGSKLIWKNLQMCTRFRSITTITIRGSMAGYRICTTAIFCGVRWMEKNGTPWWTDPLASGMSPMTTWNWPDRPKRGISAMRISMSPCRHCLFQISGFLESGKGKNLLLFKTLKSIGVRTEGKRISRGLPSMEHKVIIFDGALHQTNCTAHGWYTERPDSRSEASIQIRNISLVLKHLMRMELAIDN